MQIMHGFLLYEYGRKILYHIFILNLMGLFINKNYYYRKNFDFENQ